MSNKMGALISALMTLILFVGIPYLLPSYLPSDLLVQLEQSGFDLADFSNQVMMIGGVTATITLIGGFVNPTSISALLVKIVQAGFSLILIVVFLGAGDVRNLGYTNFNIVTEGVQSIIRMDLRIFVYISIATVLLRVVKAYFEWKEARIEAAPPGRIAP
jgi:hypothetical protein